MTKIYRVQLNSKGMPNFSTAEEVADRPKGEWTIRFVKVDNGRGGTYRERRWYCSACSGWQTYGETDFCPYCGADMRQTENDMRGEDNE